MKKEYFIGAGILVLIIIVSLFMFSNETSIMKRETIPIIEMSNSKVLQKMNQSNSEINKFNMDLSMTYEMENFYSEGSIRNTLQIDTTLDYDRIKKEAFMKGTIIDEKDGKKEITEMEREIKGDYITEKRNGEVVNVTKVEGGYWGAEVKFFEYYLDPYYIPPGENFERLESEIIDGIDCYVMIMYHDVNKVIEAVMAPKSQTELSKNYTEGTGEVYVKIWLDKTDLHLVKSKNYLNITSERFSWFIDGDLLISNVS